MRRSRRERSRDLEKNCLKKVQKVEKKVLTKRRSCDILTKLSRKTETAKHLENYIVHQQTSQVNSDRKIENNGRERNTTKRKK